MNSLQSKNTSFAYDVGSMTDSSDGNPLLSSARNELDIFATGKLKRISEQKNFFGQNEVTDRIATCLCGRYVPEARTNKNNAR